MQKYLAFLLRGAAALLVFTVTLALFGVAVALVAYRLPSFEDRLVFEGDIEPRKLDMSHRSLFETVFGNGLVPLNEHTELYLPKEGNPWIGLNDPVYRVTVSASPLLFGGYADAKLLKVVRVDRRR